jgi:hypothetical protein
MRRSFTKAERQLARKFAVSFKHHRKLVERDFDWMTYDKQKRLHDNDRSNEPEPEHVTDIALQLVARELSLIGVIRHGQFRTAFVTSKLVFKVQRQRSDDSSLTAEFRFIERQKKTVLARHFPLTMMEGRLVMMQERIKQIDVAKLRHLNDDVGALAEYLSIEDVHGQNFGWSGPPGREWPVFIDLDFRIGRTRGRKKKIRSWMLITIMNNKRKPKAA